MRTEPHPSFQNVMGTTLAANNGRFMAPAQLAELAEAQIAAQVLGPSYLALLPAGCGPARLCEAMLVPSGSAINGVWTEHRVS